MLAMLCKLFEVGGLYPRLTEAALARLLAKKDGGSRPIMLFRSVLRVHTAKRGQVMQLQMFNHAPGRRIGDSTYRAEMRHALAARKDGQGKGRYHALEILWDLTKAYDKVDRGRALAEGHRLAYPLATAVAQTESGELHTWKRALDVEGGVSTDWMQAHEGLAPGSVLAVYQLTLALHEYITQVLTRPLNSAVLHVHDTTLRFVSRQASSRGSGS